MSEERQPKFFYGYIIVLVSFVIQFVAWGIFYVYGVFFNPLLDEFGWTRATLSGANSFAYILLGFTGIFVGRLGDRFGPRMSMAACGFFLGLGCLLFSQVNTIWQLYLFYGVLVGIGMSGTDVLTLSTIARWFTKRRGMMSGLIKVGTGIGMFVFPIAANWLILNYGWRQSNIIIGIVALVLIISVAQFLRRDPGKKGLVPHGESEAGTGNVNAAGKGFALGEVVYTRQFWMICIISFCFIFCAQTILVHIAPHALELGGSATNAANVLATIGGVSIAGRFVMGSAGDKIGYKSAMIVCFVILGAALFWLQLVNELWMLYLFAIMYGFAHGGFFTLLSPLIAEFFGLISHGVILGIVIFSGTVGGAIGPLLTGRIFDVVGSYQQAFLILAIISVMALVILLLLRPTATKVFSR